MGDPTGKESKNQTDVNEEDVMVDAHLDQDDVEEVIVEDDNEPDSGELVEDLDDMDLEGDGAESGNDEAMGPPRDDATATFDKHKGSVFCVHVDPKDSSLAVTGGEDDKAYVWKVADGSQVMECTGHKDSVTCAAFSHDSMYVATGDMSGLIKVWKVSSGEEVWSFETSDLEWIEWHHLTHVLLVGTADGDTWMFKIPSGDTKTFQSHGVSSTVGKIMPDGKRAVIGYQDGAIKVWDLKSGSVLQSITGHSGHANSITIIDCHTDNTLILTGSADVTTKLISTSTGKVLSTFNCNNSEKKEEDDDSVEAVGFSKTGQNLGATGTLTGRMTIWDLSTQTARHQCQHEAGIVRMKWDTTQPLIYTCTLDGVVHLWDARTGERVRQWYGHREEILDLDISRDGTHIVTGSGDETARVFSTSSSEAR